MGTAIPMAVPWGLLAFVAGLAYGYFVPGHTDKSRLYGKALLWGVLLALALVVVGWVTGTNPLGIAADPLGFVIGFAVMLLVFVVGVWLGDWIESRRGGAHGRYRTG